MNKFKIDTIFKVEKPIIGMLHLDYLEGEKFKGIKFVVDKALKDIDALQKGGINGILIENWKELSTVAFVSEETVRSFEKVVKNIAPFIKVPFGINVLNNDYKVAFSIAKSNKAAFVQLDVFVDKVKSDFKNNKTAMNKPFKIIPSPRKIGDYAKSIDAENIPLFVFVQPKHYIMLEKEKTIEESTKQAIKAGASGIIVTKATGFAPTADLIKKTKNIAGKTPVGIGSGFSIDNASKYLPIVDFVIVGSSLKIDGITDNLIDPIRVSKLMNIIKSLRD